MKKIGVIPNFTLGTQIQPPPKPFLIFDSFLKQGGGGFSFLASVGHYPTIFPKPAAHHSLNNPIDKKNINRTMRRSNRHMW